MEKECDHKWDLIEFKKEPIYNKKDTPVTEYKNICFYKYECIKCHDHDSFMTYSKNGT